MSEIKTETESLTSRLGNCEVCAKNAARYACPKCEVKTCSLTCVQIHKRELDCDGIRDRTKYLPLSAMTERDFMSDYCFLEECTRYADTRKQDKSKRYTHQQCQLPVPLHRMRSEAAKRRIRLQFLLPHFTRRKQNTTFLNWKQQRFYWHIEWMFCGTEAGVTCFSDARCDEQQTLSQLLDKYLNLEDQEVAREQRKHLQQHQIAGIGQLTLWLRAEGVRRSSSRCYALAAHKTLAENLVGKTIVEFPSIYVSYEQRPPNGYEIVDSDEEEEESVAAPPVAASKRPQDEASAAKKCKVSNNVYGLAADEQHTDDDDDEEDQDQERHEESENESAESAASSDELPIEYTSAF
ncbi:box C/D snoRNA protein 1 [Drosophila albomicans]|uniref:Box C/D snoRNA protein 1 n=1 Tax=Drosophila albomicans TaxID=7291 RepID=A0A6P8W665_DROAB|nr:box C/D snoRNA protein 1 [Drosophila albomicans]